MIVDFDDFCETDHRLDLLHRLREANPLFRCTLFAIPARGSDAFWESVPDWCELAMHGWDHPHPRECQHWTLDETMDAFFYSPDRFVNGFKAPGWQINDNIYRVARKFGWWIADHWDNDHCRPEGLLCHRISPDYRTAGNHWHGHIPDVCGNGIAETFPELFERVRQAESFELVSEVVEPWHPRVLA